MKAILDAPTRTASLVPQSSTTVPATVVMPAPFATFIPLVARRFVPSDMRSLALLVTTTVPNGIFASVT